MSTFSDKHVSNDRRDALKSMTQREQLGGMLILFLVLLLAIVLRSL